MPPSLPSFTLSQSVAETFTAGVLYGLYLITTCYANRWLFFADEGWKLRKHIQWFMAVTANILSALLLVNTALVLHAPMAEATFIEQGHTPQEYVSPSWDDPVRCVIANSIALVADIVLMHRLWVVYGRNLWILFFPAFLWVAGIACTVVQGFLQVKHISDPNFGPYQWASVNMNVGPGIALIPFWGSTVVLNAYSTGLLIWRIRRASKEGENPTGTKQLQYLIRIFMESGVLYLAISIAHFFVWFGQDNFAIHMIGGMNLIIIGISFNLILIRTAQSRAEEGEIDYCGRMSTMHFKSKPIMISVEYPSESLETASMPTIHPSLIASCNASSHQSA
ncbi:hypothetical protein P691DRAFT_774065 [Macrolepiota fuliginosa MF-IS2]|uniref:Uncharacterized protein n=1 Tax=Macrolepiota fuliginosa MF-IS2 TaxID=1400762 RepID=A0A9P5XIP5_9AGAR|nr:hypothetical protein P691DRAFT_774065 [Macrolepiota fuliginosa MF-IS2]